MKKEADLEGEELLSFRTGRELYTYCNSCVNSARTPITGVLGCTKGDAPEIIKYSEEIDNEEHDENTPKCPGFESTEMATISVRTEILALGEDSKEGDLLKEIPSAGNEVHQFAKGKCKFCGKDAKNCTCKHAEKDTVMEDLHRGLETIKRKRMIPEELQSRIERDVKNLESRTRKSWDSENPKGKDYSWQDSPSARDELSHYRDAILHLATDSDVSDPALADSFLEQVRTEVSPSSPKPEQHAALTSLLVRNNLVDTASVNDSLLDRILQTAFQMG